MIDGPEGNPSFRAQRLLLFSPPRDFGNGVW